MKPISVPLSAKRSFARNFWPAIVGIVVLLVSIPIFDPTPAFKVIDGRVFPEHARPGEFAQVQWSVEWNRLYPCVIHRQVRNSEGRWDTIDSYRLRVPRELGPTQGGSEFKVSVFAPSGTGTYRSTAHCRRPWLLWTIPLAPIELPDLEFNVVR